MPNKITVFKPDFKVVTGELKSYQDEGTLKQCVRGTASSSVVDMVGDQFTEKAIVNMAKRFIGKTVYLNHQYVVPESVFGTIKGADVVYRYDENGNRVADLDIDIDVETENPRAAQTLKYIQNNTKLGISVGVNVKHAVKSTDSMHNGKPVVMIEECSPLEASIVGIPANQRSWVQTALKSLTKKSDDDLTDIFNGFVFKAENLEDVEDEDEDTDATVNDSEEASEDEESEDNDVIDVENGHEHDDADDDTEDTDEDDADESDDEDEDDESEDEDESDEDDEPVTKRNPLANLDKAVSRAKESAPLINEALDLVHDVISRHEFAVPKTADDIDATHESFINLVGLLRDMAQEIPGELGVNAYKLLGVLEKEAFAENRDDGRIQAVHDIAHDLGATCDEVTGTVTKSLKETSVKTTDTSGSLADEQAVSGLFKQIQGLVERAATLVSEKNDLEQRVAELESELVAKNADLDEAKRLIKVAMTLPNGRKHTQYNISLPRLTEDQDSFIQKAAAIYGPDLKMFKENR